MSLLQRIKAEVRELGEGIKLIPEVVRAMPAFIATKLDEVATSLVAVQEAADAQVWQPRRVFVLAPTYQAFRSYCRENNLIDYGPEGAKFIGHPDHLRGYRLEDISLKWAPRWYEHPNATEIARALSCMV